MKKIKKLGISTLALMLGLGASTTLVGCNDNPDEMQVMSLSVNPGIEFIVDEDDKVVSVSASNEDGAYILEKYSEFAGMSAKDAALKFIELSEEYGFVVEGFADGEKITISVSGEGAEDLYKDVKAKINDKITQLGLEIDSLVKITEEKLEEIVAQCYQEYSDDQIEELDEENLIDLLKKSREETKELHTEHERLEYYQERALKVVESRISAIQQYLSENPSLENIALTPYTQTLNALLSQLQNIYNEVIKPTLSPMYNQLDDQVTSYINKKQEYLDIVKEYRDAIESNDTEDNINTLKETMKSLKKESKSKFEALEEGRDDAKDELKSQLTLQVQSIIDSINSNIDKIMEIIDLSKTEMDKMQKDMNNFINSKIDEIKNSHNDNSLKPWNKNNN